MTTESRRILIVDDDALVCRSLAEFLAAEGYRSVCASSAEDGLDLIIDGARGGAESSFDPVALALVDMSLPGMDGLEFIRRVRRDHPGVVMVAITGFGTIEQAVETVRHGAFDYLTKPLVDDELRLVVEKALRQQALLAENSTLRHQLDQRYGLDNIVGTDPRMCRIFEIIEAVAPSTTTVLMCGESGTGKSQIARAIHRHSPRAERPFVEISCGSIPESLLESELFGHTKGAFTGAHADKPGRFLAAHNGTLFLDEINSASPGMQLKLLRVLQERTFEPVGSNEPVEVDVRIILASNQPLEDLVAAGTFRQDLYYRINVVNVELPPLRDRLADIPLLAETFLERYARELGKQLTGFSDEAGRALQAYAYPGNVRELENIVQRAVVLTRTTRIEVDDLPPNVIDNRPSRLLPALGPGLDGWTPMPLRKALEEPEKQIILAALEANDWNRQQTADQLEINRTTLYKKIKQYGLESYGRAG